MRRIAIIGSPGSGKSTLSRALGGRLGLPVFHLDRMFWRANWQRTPKAEWIAAQSDLVDKPAWIIDGNYDSTFGIRLRRADTILHLDLPTAVCLARVIKRTVSRAPRDDMNAECPERPFTKDYAEFLLWVARFRRDKRPGILKSLDGLEHGPRVVTLRSAARVRDFLIGIRS